MQNDVWYVLRIVAAFAAMAALLVVLKAPGGRPYRVGEKTVFPPKLTGRILAIIAWALPLASAIAVIQHPRDSGLWAMFLFFAAFSICGFKMWSNRIVLDELGITTRRWGKSVSIAWSQVADIRYERHGKASGHRLVSADGTELYLDRNVVCRRGILRSCDGTTARIHAGTNPVTT